MCKVRKAFNFAIDHEAFGAALAGLAEPAYMNLPKSHWAYDESVADLYPYNPDMSKKLLAEAGKEGVSIDLVGNPDQDLVQRQEILIEMFRKGGMNVRFMNAPIAEASAAFFGAEKRGSGILQPGRGGRTEPDLFADVHQGRLLSMAAARRCRRNWRPRSRSCGPRKISSCGARLLQPCSGW